LGKIKILHPQKHLISNGNGAGSLLSTRGFYKSCLFNITPSE